MARLHTLAALVVLVTGSACRQTASAPLDTRPLEARVLRDFEMAWNRDFTRLDVERLVSRYTEDATLQLPNTPPAAGTQAIRAAWKAAVQDGNFSMRLEAAHVEVARSGDVAYSQGTYTGTLTDPASGKRMRGAGTYVIVYRKGAANAWKVVSDIHTNSDPPVEDQ
jgi:ketosteroid isomerase-like protein